MRSTRAQKGQSMVEFALIFPLLIFLLTGLFDLGRAVFAYSTMNTAVREGTRWAIVQESGTPVGDIEAKVRGYYFDLKDLSDNSVVTINYVGTEEDPKIQIEIEYTFHPITPGVAQLLGSGGTILINAESSMYLAPIAK